MAARKKVLLKVIILGDSGYVKVFVCFQPLSGVCGVGVYVCVCVCVCVKIFWVVHGARMCVLVNIGCRWWLVMRTQKCSLVNKNP